MAAWSLAPFIDRKHCGNGKRFCGNCNDGWGNQTCTQYCGLSNRTKRSSPDSSFEIRPSLRLAQDAVYTLSGYGEYTFVTSLWKEISIRWKLMCQLYNYWQFVDDTKTIWVVDAIFAEGNQSNCCRSCVVRDRLLETSWDSINHGSMRLMVYNPVGVRMTNKKQPRPIGTNMRTSQHVFHEHWHVCVYACTGTWVCV